MIFLQPRLPATLTSPSNQFFHTCEKHVQQHLPIDSLSSTCIKNYWQHTPESPRLLPSHPVNAPADVEMAAVPQENQSLHLWGFFFFFFHCSSISSSQPGSLWQMPTKTSFSASPLIPTLKFLTSLLCISLQSSASEIFFWVQVSFSSTSSLPVSQSYKLSVCTSVTSHTSNSSCFLCCMHLYTENSR